MLKLKSFTEDHDRSMVPPLFTGIPTSVRRTNLYFHFAQEFYTQTLAYMLDSLVRVSRRVGYNYFVRITMPLIPKDAKRDIAPRYIPSFSSKAFNSEEPTFLTTRFQRIISMRTRLHSQTHDLRHVTNGQRRHWLQSVSF